MQKTIGKIVALILSVIIIVIHLFQTDFHLVGIYEGGREYARFVYQFFHASWWHLVVNVWVLLSVAFFFNISVCQMIIAYIVSATTPIYWSLPVVGLSGAIYFLLGSISFDVRNRYLHQAWMWIFLAIGFFTTGSAGGLHLYCYVIGLFYALCGNLNIRRDKQR